MVPERMAYARKRAGLTQAQVGERTGIGESSLSEFEHGKREPSLSQLQALASLYRRSVAFFLGEGQPAPEVVLWRKRPESGAEGTEAEFLRLCEQYHNLEVWTGKELPVCLPDVKGEPARYAYPDAESLAKRVRDAMNLGDRPALSLLAVLEEVCGVKVFHLDFEPSGTAASARSEAFGAAILLNRTHKRWRRNFDLAHELFHLLTWSIFRQAAPAQTTSSCAGEQEEKLATCFARNLLMPVEAFRAAVQAKVRQDKITFEDLYDVARQFDVSLEAALRQTSFLRLLGGTQHDVETAVERASLLAPVFEKREETEPPVRPERFWALAVQALRHGAISIGRFAEYLGITRQEAMRYIEQEVTEDEEVPVAPA
jgi:Zn-dependent peptidase ImmA (M78 family)/transcriptional regulator with XRE-family HTH domain